MKKKFNIIGKRKFFFIFSSILMIICIGSLLINGLNYGIDFKGGTIIQIELHKSFETDEIRGITDTFDESADITYAGEEQTQLIINTQESLNEEQIDSLFDEFQEKYGLEDKDLLSSDKVSATIGSEFKTQSILASVVAVLLILVYITFRFEFLFGISAILALAHDLIVVLGAYSLFGVEVNSPFIAAMLTILGFSVNDTIVIFDRIRENRRKYKKNQLFELTNDSVNQTMGRSINTTLCVLLAIISLYLMGVQSIQDFILPLIIGFISGSYSTIFIASSFWYVVEEKRQVAKA